MEGAGALIVGGSLYATSDLARSRAAGALIADGLERQSPAVADRQCDQV